VEERAPIVGLPPTPEARREGAILDVMTENARRKTDNAEITKRVLIIVASILFFPIALPIYLVIWIVKANSRRSK